MEITRQNFNERYEDVVKAVKGADFLAIDCEFTGLGTSSCKIHSFDTPESRYHKQRQCMDIYQDANKVVIQYKDLASLGTTIGVADILTIQFGLCAFSYDEVSKKYMSQAFNFYVFPRPFSRQAPDIRFLCQSTSIEFLISQGFDFNKLFKEGISYLSLEDEQRMRAALREKHEKLSSRMTSPSFTSPSGDLVKGPMMVPEEQKAFMDGIYEKVDEFLASNKETLELLPCNGYLRKLTYSNLAYRYKSSIHLESKTNEQNLRYVVVVRVKSEDDFRERELRKRHAERQELDNAVGFARVIKLISESNKLVVGHNMLLDVLNIINRFWCPLPESYEDFKNLVQCVFPSVVDTKLMANSYPFKDVIFNTSLGDLQKVLESRPFVKPDVVFPEGFPGYSTESERLHEAGYDAFITGLCFITMSNYLGTFEIPAVKHIPTTSQLLQPFQQRLFLMRVFDIPYMNLDGLDEEPVRNHVFHVTFPKEWRTLDISQLFLPFGGVYVAWLDDTTAFVSLNRKDQADHVMKLIPPSDLYRIMPYSEYVRKEEIANRPISNMRKRKTPASDVDIRPKRKRSIEEVYSEPNAPSSDPTGGKSKIPTIQEEDEIEEKEETQNNDFVPQHTPKKARKEENSNDKLFDEEPIW